ncbi:hypothetical protein [Rhodovulum euryhalinum]|uniref:DUF4177 domain-containing protein n=1 Tax=Rhodovulum euryhalinum TaxID=35805 RepID=A0A4R2KMA6_9RHOB|nr:hypothetical protein [Rhodovulum euryhalinum]TCO71168.1 hypothetical protein EV655_10760 [Rhodovulum euryhalinum]
MLHYEFTVLPAPTAVRRVGQGRKDEVFSSALTDIMNEMGAAGWDFAGAETLPCRVGRWPFARLADRRVLVFRRARESRLDRMAAAERAAPLYEDALEITVQPRRVSTADTPRTVRKLRPTLHAMPAHATAAE